MSPEQKGHLRNNITTRCEAPDGCSVTSGLTVDHFTPKCVAKILGWSRKKLNAPSNRQLLCWDHHLKKDSVTPQIKQQLKFQLSGGFIPFEKHVVSR